MEKDRLYAFGEKAALPVLFLLVIPVWGAAQILNTPVICVYRFGIYVRYYFGENYAEEPVVNSPFSILYG